MVSLKSISLSLMLHALLSYVFHFIELKLGEVKCVFTKYVCSLSIARFVHVLILPCNIK